MRDLGAALRELTPPDETAARERTWRVARAAFEQRPPAPRRRRRGWLVALVATAALGTALSPPGEALGEWVRKVMRNDPAPPPPALATLPAPGRILALAGGDLWLVHDDGARRRLGSYDDGTLSPGARFVAATRAHRLTALDLRGNVRWALDRPPSVDDPRWAPSGLRVAYRAGRELRVVYGDGALDRRIARRVAPVAPAWAPGVQHVLAWADRRGRVIVEETDSRRRVWRTASGPVPATLAWSPAGQLLVVRGDRAVVHGAGGAVVSRVGLTGDGHAAAWLPAGGGFVIAARDGARSVVSVHGRGHRRVLFAGPGAVRQVTPSPRGRWVLVAWSGARQWVFVRTDGRGRPRVAPAVARDFDPSAGERAAFPVPLAWR